MKRRLPPIEQDTITKALYALSELELEYRKWANIGPEGDIRARWLEKAGKVNAAHAELSLANARGETVEDE